MSTKCGFNEGDKSKGICQNCGLVETVFKVREVTFSNELNKKVIIPDILASCCVQCDSMVGIPQQSVSQIKKTIDEK